MSILGGTEKCCIVITGNEFGFGLPLTKRLLQMGHQVIAVGRSQACLDKAKEECPSLVTILADVGNEEQRQKMLIRVSTQFPQVNVLINNSGICRTNHKLTEVTDSDWQGYKEEMSANLKAQMWLTARFMPHLLEKRASLIINVSSALALEPDPSSAGYSATKAALHAFSKVTHSQCLDTQVVVVEILPSPPSSSSSSSMVDPSSSSEVQQMEAFVDHVMKRLLVGDLEIKACCKEDFICGDKEKEGAAAEGEGAVEMREI